MSTNTTNKPDEKTKLTHALEQTNVPIYTVDHKTGRYKKTHNYYLSVFFLGVIVGIITHILISGAHHG